MSINFAILGLLSYKSLSGYDLKKIIQDSPFMHWSGNNNQIYKALVELLDDGFVTNEVQHQESSPSKKIYTITDDGRSELKRWVQSAPEPPELKKTFLVQLAWADLLSPSELDDLLSKYEEEIQLQLAAHEEKKRRDSFSPKRTEREVYLWTMIHENMGSYYRNELQWLRQIREGLGINVKEENGLNIQVIEKNNRKIVYCSSAEVPISTGQDALDLISVTYEHDTDLVLIHADALSGDFFKLRSGVAGEILQKFVNYQRKAALIISSSDTVKGKARELLAETNKGNAFRTFGSMEEAESWLIGE